MRAGRSVRSGAGGTFVRHRRRGPRTGQHTAYGLASSAWTTTCSAQRATREIQPVCVWINDHIPIISEMAHGGYKASRSGKEMSTYSFDKYTNIKHVMSDITGNAHKGWYDTIFGG